VILRALRVIKSRFVAHSVKKNELFIITRFINPVLYTCTVYYSQTIRWHEKGTELSFHLTLLSRNKGTYVFKNKIMYENDCYNIANTSVSFRTNNRPEKSKTVALVSFVLHNSFRDKSCEMTRCEIYGGRSKHFLRKQDIKYM